MIRRIVAGMIAIGLGLGIWALWPRGGTTPSTTTRGPVADQTTTPDPDSTTTSSVESTTTTTVESHVVETVEEAEEILRELWFGWFEGIYNQDEDRIREVVATEHQVDLARAQFGVMEFAREPSRSDLALDNTEILSSDDSCLVIWTTFEATGFTDATTTDVHVLRWHDSRWGIFSIWALKGDRWDEDCNSVLGS